MNASPPPDPIPKSRFYILSRRGQLRIVICLTLAEAQRLGALLSRGVVAAILHRFGKLTTSRFGKPSNPPVA